jgi:hypothetical protein
LKNVQFCSISRKAKILTADIHQVFRELKSESDAEIGQKGTFFKALSVEIHVYMMTHTIPNPFGIAVPAVVVVTVNEVMFVVNGFLFTHPGSAVRTTYILNVFFFHVHLN